MTTELPPENDRWLWRIVEGAVALSLGAMAAFFWSVKAVNPTLRFEFSFGTVVAFLVGTAVSLVAWRLMVGTGRGRKAGLVVFSLFLCLVTAGAFVYGLKDVGGERAADFVVGTAWAVAFLVGVGFLLWRTGRFFEEADARQRKAEEAKKREQTVTDPPE